MIVLSTSSSTIKYSILSFYTICNKCLVEVKIIEWIKKSFFSFVNTNGNMYSKRRKTLLNYLNLRYSTKVHFNSLLVAAFDNYYHRNRTKWE